MWKKNDEMEVESVHTSNNLGSNNNVRKSVSTVGAKSVVVGEVKGEEDLVVMGVVDGTITLSKNTVTVGKTGTVKGMINSQAILVEGTVEGDLKALDKIILRASAKVKGNIAAGRLVMEDGCYFQGGIDMVEVVKPTAVPKPAAPKPVAPKPAPPSKP